MIETITITHHASKPEYQWEFVIPEGPTVLLRQEALDAALGVLGLPDGHEVKAQIAGLPNGESQSVNADLKKNDVERLAELGVKTKAAQPRTLGA